MLERGHAVRRGARQRVPRVPSPHAGGAAAHGRGRDGAALRRHALGLHGVGAEGRGRRGARRAAAGRGQRGRRRLGEGYEAYDPDSTTTSPRPATNVTYGAPGSSRARSAARASAGDAQYPRPKASLARPPRTRRAVLFRLPRASSTASRRHRRGSTVVRRSAHPRGDLILSVTLCPSPRTRRATGIVLRISVLASSKRFRRSKGRFA